MALLFRIQDKVSPCGEKELMSETLVFGGGQFSTHESRKDTIDPFVPRAQWVLLIYKHLISFLRLFSQQQLTDHLYFLYDFPIAHFLLGLPSRRGARTDASLSPAVFFSFPFLFLAVAPKPPQTHSPRLSQLHPSISI